MEGKNPEKSGFIPQERIREALHAVHPREAAIAYGAEWPEVRDSGQVRLRCPFREECNTSSYGALTLNLDEPHKPIFCHTCHTQGDLLTLMWGWKHGVPPASGKLRGSEFKEIRDDLLAIAEGRSATRAAIQATVATPQAEQAPPSLEESPPPANVPLRLSDNERARELVKLHETLLGVPDESMNAAAAAYFRARPWLTPEVAREWRMGYLPHSAKGLLRGRIVYAYPSESNDILTYFGRDPEYEKRHAKWIKDGSPENRKPIKTRFVKGFHRGLELYGQQHCRLKDPRIKESLRRFGIVICEGPNGVIRMNCAGIAAVGLCSNRATDEQTARIVRFARQVAGGRIAILHDLDDEGETGARDLLWKLCQSHDLSVRLAWSRESHSGRFAERQPESLTDEEIEALF